MSTGVLYGLVGVFALHVLLDVGLLCGALLLAVAVGIVQQRRAKTTDWRRWRAWIAVRLLRV